jgi:polysaccharide export outer membrane protein
MKWIQIAAALAISLLAARGQINASSKTIAATSGPPAAVAQTYVLSPSDVVQVKVYQEDDLEAKLRIGRDGTTSFPLIGVINLGGKTVAEAAALLRDELAKDYLVNPQVTVTVVEYAKRRFTVLGQVQKPGSFEIPNEESVTLLQAIAMAGGYTRLANKGNVRVTRSAGRRKATFSLDVNHAANDLKTEPFVILPDDTITVSERLF